MRSTSIAIAVSIVLTAATMLPAQEDRRSSLHEVATQSIPAMRREISLDLRRVRLDAALQEIALRADLPLMYSPEILPKNRTVSLSAEKIEVERALREVLRASGLDVIALSSGQVIVVRKDVEGSDARRVVGTVTGRVADRTTGQPVAAAQVTVAGTRLSRLTDETGRYVLPGVPAGQRELRVMRLGYEAQTQAVTVVEGGTVALDFSLAPLASRLAEVVTTVTGDQRRAEVGHVIGTIDADSLVREAPVTTLTDVINARVPGVQVIQYGGLTGFSPRVRVRGINSVSLANDPLLVVDGVRMENSTAGTTAFGQSSGRLNDLNPEEIESIELVKGPSAATLYGTDAANGVIVVTTKRGRPGPARWSLYVEQGLIDQPSDFPDNYFSWGRNATTGAVQQCPLVQQAAGVCVADSLTTFNPFENPAASPVGTGRRSQYGVQVSGGASQFTYFLSGEYEEETGFLEMPAAEERRVSAERGGASIPDEQLRPNALQRVSVRGNARAAIGENADVTLSTGFVSSDIRIPSNAIFQGGYWGSGDPNALTRWFGGSAPGEIFAVRNAESVNHFTGSLAANWRPITWLTTRGTVGIDFSANALDGLQRRGEGPAGPNRNGRRQNVRTEVELYSADAGASAFFDLTPRLGSRTSAGAQFNRRVQRVTVATGTNLPPGSETVTGAAVVTGAEFFGESVVAGAYVEQTLDLDRRLYVTGGLRADGASGFGRSFRTAFYPKASASWLALDARAGALNSLRLRLAYGASGVQPGSTDALSLIGLSPVIVNGASATGAAQTAFGDRNLKPERQTEFEAGADAELFGSRLRMEATFYDRLSRDALIDRPLPTSFGVATRRENIGSVRNRGVEGLVTARLIDRPRLGWDVSVNGSVNRNRLERLADDVPFINHASTIQSREGHPLFGFWFRPILGFSDANANGIIEPNEVQVGDTAVFSGASLPTRQLTASTALSLFGDRVRIATQFDYRGGFKQFNNNELVRCAFANCAAVNDPRASLAAQAAIVAATTPSLGRTFHGYAVDGEFVRWRELSLTYAAPQALSRRLGAESLSITLTGRNLHLFSGYGGIDPEVNAFPGVATVEGFADLATAPPPRYWILRLNLGL